MHFVTYRGDRTIHFLRRCGGRFGDTLKTSPVHLRGTGDHVLHVIGVSGAVDVRVVPFFRLVLHVRGVDRDLASPGVVTNTRGKCSR